MILFYTSNACMFLVLLKINGVMVISLQIMHSSILNYNNNIYLDNSFDPKLTTNNPTPISQLTSNTLSDITAKLDEIK